MPEREKKKKPSSALNFFFVLDLALPGYQWGAPVGQLSRERLGFREIKAAVPRSGFGDRELDREADSLSQHESPQAEGITQLSTSGPGMLGEGDSQGAPASCGLDQKVISKATLHEGRLSGHLRSFL